MRPPKTRQVACRQAGSRCGNAASPGGLRAKPRPGRQRAGRTGGPVVSVGGSRDGHVLRARRNGARQAGGRRQRGRSHRLDKITAASSILFAERKRRRQHLAWMKRLGADWQFPPALSPAASPPSERDRPRAAKCSELAA